jgi:ABC-2 type transport system ATP-binding protein
VTHRPAEANAVPLIVESAAKRFGTVQALAGASFDVRRGELLGLLGPNGAGKTTLIKAIAGRVKLEAGVIRLFGRVLSPGDQRPDIGVVPQELGVYKLHTARENLEVFGKLYGVSGSMLKERVAWALAWAGLEDRANEPVGRFSGGMKRRLNIACSLLHSPSLVLLDEPTVGVDPQSRERIYEMLATLQASGVSMVLTTHHLEEAERRCERIVIIDHGRTVAAGTIAELMASAVGSVRTLTITLGRPLAAGAIIADDAEIDAARRTVTSPVRDVGRDVPALLAEVRASGGEITDIGLSGASLQDVFIALTGRELRE